MRKYEEVWIALKARKNHKVELVVKPIMVPRVKKAIIKEKDQDKAFKMANDIDRCRLVIVYNKEKEIMSFKLVQPIGILGIKEEIEI